ncbi:unnamed protein product [Durusdinium trenchii]|uniref:Uncharacterized protein n=1 Tax=Durusdinium trenchii TaxID=1381693 RepID=A0ABP0JRF5_9DINO
MAAHRRPPPARQSGALLGGREWKSLCRSSCGAPKRSRPMRARRLVPVTSAGAMRLSEGRQGQQGRCEAYKGGQGGKSSGKGQRQDAKGNKGKGRQVKDEDWSPKVQRDDASGGTAPVVLGTPARRWQRAKESEGP